MSSDAITLKLTERKEFGKAVKALRRQGIVPANIYERGKESIAVSAKFAEITKVYKHAGKHSPVELDVDGKKHLAMIKDVDLNVSKNTLAHVAFHAVNRNEKVEAEVPIKIDGEVPAEKTGLLVLQNLSTVFVEALPANLPEELYIKGDMLNEDGDKVTVADIKVPENVVITTDPETMVFSVETPRDQIAEANAALEEQQVADGIEPTATEAESEQESTTEPEKAE